MHGLLGTLWSRQSSILRAKSSSFLNLTAALQGFEMIITQSFAKNMGMCAVQSTATHLCASVPIFSQVRRARRRHPLRRFQRRCRCQRSVPSQNYRSYQLLLPPLSRRTRRGRCTERSRTVHSPNSYLYYSFLFTAFLRQLQVRHVDGRACCHGASHSHHALRSRGCSSGLTRHSINTPFISRSRHSPQANGTPGIWTHISTQQGMFAFTGLNPLQVDALTSRHHVPPPFPDNKTEFQYEISRCTRALCLL